MKRNAIITYIQVVLLVLPLLGLIVTVLSTSDPKKLATAIVCNFMAYFWTVLLEQFKK